MVPWSVMSYYYQGTGIGIPSEKSDLLFKKFSQVDATKTRRHGLPI